MSFCSCDHDWADPECRTRRLSQTKVFLLSLFGGIVGADYFYLGLPLWGIAKLCTLGGLGVWWFADIIRTGAGPIYAANYRVAPDLQHWIFVFVVVTLFSMAGFIYSMISFFRFRSTKRRIVMQLQQSEGNMNVSGPEDLAKFGPQYQEKGSMKSFVATRGFSGYGATLPVSMPKADAPYASIPARGQVGPIAGPYGSMPPLA